MKNDGNHQNWMDLNTRLTKQMNWRNHNFNWVVSRYSFVKSFKHYGASLYSPIVRTPLELIDTIYNQLPAESLTRCTYVHS